MGRTGEATKELLLLTRRTGKTTQLIELLKNNPNAAIVICNRIMYKRIKAAGIPEEQIIDVRNVDMLRGLNLSKRAVHFDSTVIHNIINEYEDSVNHYHNLSLDTLVKLCEMERLYWEEESSKLFWKQEYEKLRDYLKIPWYKKISRRKP